MEYEKMNGQRIIIEGIEEKYIENYVNTDIDIMITFKSEHFLELDDVIAIKEKYGVVNNETVAKHIQENYLDYYEDSIRDILYLKHEFKMPRIKVDLKEDD